MIGQLTALEHVGGRGNLQPAREHVVHVLAARPDEPGQVQRAQLLLLFLNSL